MCVCVRKEFIYNLTIKLLKCHEAYSVPSLSLYKLGIKKTFLMQFLMMRLTWSELVVQKEVSIWILGTFRGSRCMHLYKASILIID